MSDLDKAIESGELKRVISGMDIAGIHPSLKLLCAAARRFLALTETGPNYEAATQTLDDEVGQALDPYRHPGSSWLWDVAKAVVDAALADYLDTSQNPDSSQHREVADYLTEEER